MNIDAFIDRLEKFPSTAGVFNQYTQALQRHNITEYLKERSLGGAKILFLGEAAGYWGCRFSGIPFCSGHILSSHTLFEKTRSRYQFKGIEEENENSANCVYQFLSDFPIAFEKSVFWNAYPFHPHIEGNLEKNRTPNTKELDAGLFILLNLIDIFQFTAIFPIGNKAEKTVQKLKQRGFFPRQEIKVIRHPARGGKKEFLEKITNIWKSLKLD